MPILGPIIISGAAAAIANHYQSKAARIADQHAHTSAELKRANDLFAILSTDMAALGSLGTEVMFGIVFRGAEATKGTQDWAEYKRALLQWKSRYVGTLAQVATDFGSAARGLLEEIQEGLSIMEQQINATFYGRTESRFYLEDREGSPNDFRQKYFGHHHPTQERMRELATLMVAAIQKQQVGALRRAR